MQFEKNHIKKRGRKKGVPNRITKDLRQTISDFLKGNFSKIKKDFKSLQPQMRVKLYIELLSYSVPKMQAVSNSYNFDSMSESDLNKIIDALTNKAIENEKRQELQDQDAA